MRLNKFTLPVLIILGFSMTGLLAQNTLIVKDAGKQTPYVLKSIRKLTFAGGDMIITQSGGNNHSYEITSVSSLDFVTISTDILRPGKQESAFVFYPVPVNDKLHIRCEEKKGGIVQVEIADLQGRVVYRQVIHELIEYGEEIIDLSQLAQGFYICRMLYGDQIETCSFFKD